jgi:hypothetical protein
MNGHPHLSGKGKTGQGHNKCQAPSGGGAGEGERKLWSIALFATVFLISLET